METTNYQSNGKTARRKYPVPCPLSPVPCHLSPLPSHLSPITYFLALCLMAMGCGQALAQGGTTTVGGGTTIPSGAALPATCDPTLAGDSNHYFYKTAAPNQGLYSCTATNTWSASGGPANAAIKPATGDAVIYLSTAGNDSNDGLSWGTAKLTFSAAITQLCTINSGGTLYVGAGTFSFSSGVTCTASGVHVVGAGEAKTILNYTGAGTAITIGTTTANTFTYSHDWENFILEMSGGGSSAIGFRTIQPFSQTFKHFKIETIKGTAGTSQIAFQCDGTGGFGAYLSLVNPFITGDFLKGVHATGTALLNGCNSITIHGGSIVNTSSPRATGTIGIHAQFGGDQKCLGTDLEGWDVAAQIEAGSVNNHLGCRYENDNTPWKTISGTASNEFWGGTWGGTGGTPVDNGTNTSWQSVASGGVNAAQLNTLTVTGNEVVNTHLGCLFNSDLCGTVTLSGGTKTITFGTAFGFTPACVVSDETTAGGARVSAKSSTAFTITGGATDVVDYICFGNPN